MFRSNQSWGMASEKHSIQGVNRFKFFLAIDFVLGHLAPSYTQNFCLSMLEAG